VDIIKNKLNPAMIIAIYNNVKNNENSKEKM